MALGGLEGDEAPRVGRANGNGGVATAVWTTAAPAVAVETDPPDE
jgi:hypothetical protein